MNRTLNAKTVVRTLARATQVAGLVFEHIAVEYRVSGKPAAWVARLGRLFWGLVEVAVPRSLSALIFGHWIRLLYLFAVLLVLGGFFLGGDGVQQFGIVVLGVTGGFDLMATLLADFMRGRARLLRTLVTMAVVVMIAFAAYGGWAAWSALSAWRSDDVRARSTTVITDQATVMLPAETRVTISLPNGRTISLPNGRTISLPNGRA